MATFVRIGDQVFPCNDRGAAGLASFIASEHEAYNGLFDDANKQLGEQGARHAAEVKAYEDLLTESQERIDQKDKELAFVKQNYADACDRAEQYAEEANDLEEQLEDARRLARWRYSLPEALVFAVVAVSLAGLLGLFK